MYEEANKHENANDMIKQMSDINERQAIIMIKYWSISRWHTSGFILGSMMFP